MSSKDNSPEKMDVPYPGERGEEVISVQQMKGTLYVFTKTAVYKMALPKRLKWYQKLFHWMTGAESISPTRN